MQLLNRMSKHDFKHTVSHTSFMTKPEMSSFIPSKIKVDADIKMGVAEAETLLIWNIMNLCSWKGSVDSLFLSHVSFKILINCITFFRQCSCCHAQRSKMSVQWLSAVSDSVDDLKTDNIQIAVCAGFSVVHFITRIPPYRVNIAITSVYIVVYLCISMSVDMWKPYNSIIISYYPAIIVCCYKPLVKP